MRLELDAPHVGELEKEYLKNAIESGFVSTFGPYVPEFERIFAEYLGTQRAVAIQSGTAALHMALYELGVGKEHEVIVPALTFVASVNPIWYVGAKPVFIDVDMRTWNMDPGLLEEMITPRTKAVIPVHLYGNPCDMDPIMRLAEKYGLHVIEDATESLGAAYEGAFTGTFGAFGCFSFNGNKIITTGGGGMLVGKATDRLDHVNFLINQARDEKKGYYHSEVGFNFRMTNIEASLGLAQIQRLEEFLAKKRSINDIYKRELAGISSVTFQEETRSSQSSCWFTCVLLDRKIDVELIRERLKERGVPTRRVFMPIVEFPPYRSYKHPGLRNSFEIYERGLCLPSSTLNTEDDIVNACRELLDLLGRY